MQTEGGIAIFWGGLVLVCDGVCLVSGHQDGICVEMRVEEVVEVDEEMDSEWKLAEIESGLPHCSFCSTKHVAEVAEQVS